MAPEGLVGAGRAYVDGLKRYTSVLVDSRGHGLSDKPVVEAAYRLEEYVADVPVVIGELGAPRVALWGYSDGAHVAAAIAALLPSGRALTLAGVGHTGVFLASERVLPHVLGVLGEGFAQPCVLLGKRGES